MNDYTGPLRVVPGSHRQPIEIPPADFDRAHSDEVLITSGPGDVIVIHKNLPHSGTHSLVATERQFLGLSYTLSCLGSRLDSLDDPNCRALLATARRMQDRRLMRLLGHDDQVTSGRTPASLRLRTPTDASGTPKTTDTPKKPGQSGVR